MLSESEQVPFPPSGEYLKAIRESSRAARVKANITISDDAIDRLLLSPAFTGTFDRLRAAHGMRLPLNFSSVREELNVLSALALLNFASGYRAPLHLATGRGAFDNIRAFVFAAHISSAAGTGAAAGAGAGTATGTTGDCLSARGMREITPGAVAELMRVAHAVHVERPHEALPGVTVGELGGPVWDVVRMVARTLNETGEALAGGGYPDLGSFVLEALGEGEKARRAGRDECEVVVERLVRGIPAFRDMALVQGEPVYILKKALLTIHAIALRFSAPAPVSASAPGPATPPPPVPRTAHLPIFADNVIPSLLVHLGILSLSSAALALPALFPAPRDPAPLLAAAPPPPSPPVAQLNTGDTRALGVGEGPRATAEQAFALRAAAVDACARIVQRARALAARGADVAWLAEVTEPELDAWLWAGAKDRADYRELPRFALRDTAFF